MIGLHELHSLPLIDEGDTDAWLEARGIDPAAVRAYAREIANAGLASPLHMGLRLGMAFVVGFTMGFQAAEIPREVPS